LITQSGLPVIALPHNARFDATRIVIGWKDAKPARRAVWDALPFLKRADDVRVLHLGSDAAAEIAALLDRMRLHGVRASAEQRNVSERGVAEDLLSAAHALRCGLIVLGGYGHSRLRERVLGGVTEELLARADVPLFLSH
jgi:nucleotide-binding universal stress UspA family protein